MTSSSTSRTRRAAIAAAVAAIAVVALYAIAQVASGASIVATHGASMLPTYATGDLVVVRPSPTYRVGDAVAYHSRLLDVVVLHRIAAIEGDTFVFQGDNNLWLDHERPTRPQLLGKHWLHIPRGGIWLRRALSPPALASSAFLLISGGGAMLRTPRRRRQRRTMRGNAGAERAAEGRGRAGKNALALSSSLRLLVAASAALAVTAAAVGALAWTRPTTGTVTADKDVTSSVTFSYSAAVRPSPAYDDTSVAAPEPIFRKLADSVDVTFRYDGPPATVAVQAELTAPSGWRSTVPLAEPRTFESEHYTGTVALDLRALQRRAEAAARATGIPGESLSVRVVPTFAAGGEVFAPALEFTLDPLALRLAQAVGPEGDEATSPLKASMTTTVTSTTRGPARLEAFGYGATVATARLAVSAGLGAALLLGAIVAAAAFMTRRQTESVRINSRHASLLVSVEPIVLPAERPVIDVPTIDSLIKLAQRYGLLVLHWSRADITTYLVHDDTTTYRYRAAPTAPPRGSQTVTPPLDAPEPPPGQAIPAPPTCGRTEASRESIRS